MVLHLEINPISPFHLDLVIFRAMTKEKKLGRRLRAVRGFLPVRKTGSRLLTQELERDLRERIRLRQHRRAGLHEDVFFGVVGALLRDVHIHDLAVGR